MTRETNIFRVQGKLEGHLNKTTPQLCLNMSIKQPRRESLITIKMGLRRCNVLWYYSDEKCPLFIIAHRSNREKRLGYTAARADCLSSAGGGGCHSYGAPLKAVLQKCISIRK